MNEKKRARYEHHISLRLKTKHRRRMKRRAAQKLHRSLLNKAAERLFENLCLAVIGVEPMRKTEYVLIRHILHPKGVKVVIHD